jgi:hypothetical protein
MPVGEVTLISVRAPPITSMPTKISPRSRSVGPMAAQISRSRSVSASFTALPPTCMFERASPFCGTRLMAPTGSPSTRITRLSPSATAGRNFCAISGSRLMFMNSSCSAARFASAWGSLKTPAPPLP